MRPSPPSLLILGGTREAATLAAALAAAGGVRVVTSLAGRTRTPLLPPGEWRSGGFGGVAGLIDYLRREAIDWVVDATHPFAIRMNAQAQQAAESLNIPLLRLLRPAWSRQMGDLWQDAADHREAASLAARHGRRVLLAIGHKDLAAFAASPGPLFLIRAIEPPDPASLPPGAEIILARGPFDLAAEKTLLEERGIDLIVAKNSGGEASYAKIAAARDLAIPVIMIARPPQPRLSPALQIAPTLPAALTWIAERISAAL